MATKHELPIDETYRRMPTLRLIDDPDLRNQTAKLTASAPAYFWDVPASSSGFHHPTCRERHGLWIHTLMLSTVIARLGSTYVEQGRLTESDLDLAHSAAILHDQRKNGPPEDPQETSRVDHELLMADVIADAGLPNPVALAVRRHMGAWYANTAPQTDLDDLVHTADMVASTSSITPGVQGPIPDELADLGLHEVDLR